MPFSITRKIKKRRQSSLDDLVSAHYIQQIPTDPMTGAKDWVTSSEDLDVSPEQSSFGNHRRALGL